MKTKETGFTSGKECKKEVRRNYPDYRIISIKRIKHSGYCASESPGYFIKTYQYEIKLNKRKR
ncbi:MAG: hypothetical protein AABY22_36530 [Nanoarchaeota archaeon]